MGKLKLKWWGITLIILLAIIVTFIIVTLIIFSSDNKTSPEMKYLNKLIFEKNTLIDINWSSPENLTCNEINSNNFSIVADIIWGVCPEECEKIKFTASNGYYCNKKTDIVTCYCYNPTGLLPP